MANKLQSVPARLVGVIWDEDRGVVDLDAGKVVMYVHGDFDGSHFNIPTVEISDSDFKPLVPDDEDLDDDALYDFANWSNVAALLTLSSFNLADKLYWPDQDSPTWTVTIAGPERHDGEKPYDYILYAASAEAAVEYVQAHFRKEQETEDTEIVGVKEGVHIVGGYNDLRAATK